ncbi:phosphoribosylformylglycinamidine synthase, partial [Halodesulfovibrio aestuarii]
MLRRIEAGLRKGVVDTQGIKTANKIREALGFDVKDVRQVKVFTVDGLTEEQLGTVVSEAALHDPVLQDAALSPVSSQADWVLEVGFRPGVTDNEGRTARETIAIVLELADREAVSVYVADQYHIYGDFTEDQIASIGRDVLANELIQRFEYKSKAEWQKEPGFAAVAARVSGQANDEVVTLPFSTMSDDELMAFSRENTLALSLEELHTIRDYYTAPDVVSERVKAGLSAEPSDAEVEVLAQTWSEHCKHKIFASK